MRTDVLPLRSLAAVWVLLSVFGLLLVAFATRGMWTNAGRGDKRSSATVPQGPTKKQVRERQEHIALTERALELARKERKAASAPSAAASSVAASSSATPLSTAAAADAPAARRAASTPAPSEASTSTSSAPAEKAAPKAAAGGLDAMRADIAAALE